MALIFGDSLYIDCYALILKTISYSNFEIKYCQTAIGTTMKFYLLILKNATLIPLSQMTLYKINMDKLSIKLNREPF
ncbi:unknown [Bacteroides sp. CAG:1076]|nr:unknown [Bacteroides sp. CAG:1076]